MFANRTLNGLGALDPLPMFVAAAVKLLLPPVTLRRIKETRGLRRCPPLYSKLC